MRKDEAIRLYVAGASMNAAGKAVGVTGQTVERWLAAAGVPIRNRRKTYPDRIRQDAIALYVGGMSAAAAADQLGLKKFTVKEWVSAAGVTRSMSEAASLAVIRGQSRARSSSRLWHTSAKTSERNFAESSLEFLRMQQLDEDDAVLHWARCPHRIAYVDPAGKRRRYVPDLIVSLRDGATVIEEIKPAALIDTALNIAKFAACREFCESRGWYFRIVTEATVGYCRSMAPSSMTKAEKRQRENQRRRQRWANETPEQRASRLKKNAEYMREFNRRRRQDLPVGSFAESGTNVPTGYLIVEAGK